MHYVRDSLVQRGKTSWRASYHPVFDDGTCGERVFETLKGCSSRREAKCAAEERRAILEEAARLNLGFSPNIPTLVDYQSDWANDLVLTGAVARKTARGYVSGIKCMGDIAYTKLNEVREFDVKHSIRFALDEGFSPNTVASNFSLMKNAFSRAQEEGLVAANPCRNVKPPKRVETRPRSLSASERLLLLSLLPQLVGALPLAIRLALSTGVRGEEVRGFTWEDWDDLEARLSVRQVVVKDDDGSLLVKGPKTPSSLRTLPVESTLNQELGKRMEWQRARCAEYGVPFSKRLFILGDIDGSPYTPDAMQRDFSSFCKAFGIECCFHWLRHTFATELVAKGVNIRTVAQWRGHTDPGFTLRVYAHADPCALADSLGVVSDLVSVPESYESSARLGACLAKGVCDDLYHK